MFALLALGGDVGCSFGPTFVGTGVLDGPGRSAFWHPDGCGFPSGDAGRLSASDLCAEEAKTAEGSPFFFEIILTQCQNRFIVKIKKMTRCQNEQEGAL